MNPTCYLRHLHASLCGRFGSNSFNTARCAHSYGPNLTKQNIHLVESVFQIRSSNDEWFERKGE
ncbi:hypothetical protein D3Z58_18735 [Clostridiaceae bacterium]|nr:hypothetical protein [Clostridiaceae bacterium]